MSLRESLRQSRCFSQHNEVIPATVCRVLARVTGLSGGRALHLSGSARINIFIMKTHSGLTTSYNQLSLYDWAITEICAAKRNHRYNRSIRGGISIDVTRHYKNKMLC